MQLQSKCLVLLASVIFALNHLPVSWARYIKPTNGTNLTEILTEVNTFNSTTLPKIIDTSNNQTSDDNVVHVKRRRQIEECRPQELNILHAPCDMDNPELGKYIETLPNQCICAYNARHNSALEYRRFKVLQLEAFFFGQYSERFKRFETDAPKFESQ